MALGDWLAPGALSAKQKLREDLEEVDARLQALEAAPPPTPGPVLHWVTGVPAPALGNDDDAAIDENSGVLYRRVAGQWERRREFWLSS